MRLRCLISYSVTLTKFHEYAEVSGTDMTGNVGIGIVETESGGTRRRTGGEVKGKEANGVGNQAGFSLTRSVLGTVRPVLLQSFSADPHSKKASTRLN